MSETVRMAMIGAGSMANRVHYPSLASFDDVEMVAVCDLDPARLAATADKYGIEGRYSDYRRMVEETAPDAVYAIGQPHLMYDIWLWCLSQGLSLYIEKPLGITLHQARALAWLAESKGCITQVSFQRRASPLAVQLRHECLQRGAIVHAIDTLRWLCGGEVVEVQSRTRRVQVPDINFISALLGFDNGATGVLVNSWSSGRRIFRVEMHAPGICAEADLGMRGASTRTGIQRDGSTRRGGWPRATSYMSTGAFRPRTVSSSMG